MAKKVLIIGGVAGGASAAARLRRLDEQVHIVIFERGKYISFANCGLPYYVGQTIKKRDNLLLQTPENFKARFNVDVRVENEVLHIDRKAKKVEVLDLKTEKKYFENYDKLILSPGAKPFKPPIPGIDNERIFMLRDVPDADLINNFIDANKPKRAVIVGAGYIGLEMAENLRHRGLLVAMVEMAEQVMPVMDREMANLLNQHLHEQSTALWLNDAVSGFRPINSKLMVNLKSGMELACDFAILSIGVKPEIKIAQESGLETGISGGIKVNEYLQTSDPDIYAAGDAIEVTDFVLDKPVLIPLAGPANRQGRIIADNICGRKQIYKKTQGTAILKVFHLTAAMTGASEKALKKMNVKYEKLYIHPAHHVGYYPGAKQMHIKFIFTKPEGKILGAQIIGTEGVDKRIDIFATAIRAGMTVFDLSELELAYAPPYGSGKDAVNMAGFVAANIIDETLKITHCDDLKKDDFILDVRDPKELTQGMIPNSVNIPLDELRQRLSELPKDKTIHTYCDVGIRSYIAARILEQHGFDSKNISGGYSTFLAYTAEKLFEAQSVKQLREQFCTGL
ncbi:MAG: CoA-disulfide reductase [Phycisphaerae bacterium]